MSDNFDYNYSSSSQPRAVPTSTMAIVALVAGILGLSFFPLFGSIVAVITGPMAKREIAESGGALSGENLAQIGSILGWIGLAFSLIGCCFVIVAFALPFVMVMLGLGMEEYNLVLPALLV